MRHTAAQPAPDTITAIGALNLVRLKPDATDVVRLKPDADLVRLKPDATDLVRLKPDATDLCANV